MKKHLFLLALVLSLFVTNTFSQTVYITKSGTKYHKENCRYLNKSKIAISLQDAIAKGYGACKVCKPPISFSNTSKSTNSNTKTKKSKTSQTQKETTTKTKTTQTTSSQCSAITKSGTRCKRMTKSPNGKCWQHGGN